MSSEEWMNTFKQDVRTIMSIMYSVICKCYKHVFQKKEETIMRPQGYEEAGNDTADYFEEDEEDSADDETKYDKEIKSDLTLAEKLSGALPKNNESYKKRSNDGKNMAVELKSVSDDNKNLLHIIEHEIKTQTSDVNTKENLHIENLENLEENVKEPQENKEETEASTEITENPLRFENLEEKDSFNDESMGDWKIAKDMYNI